MPIRVPQWDAPYNGDLDLIQWHVRQDPWRVLVACVFCNLTRRLTSEPYLWEFFKRWPTAEQAAAADPVELAAFLQPLGLSNRRAKTLIGLSTKYLKDDWSDVRELPGVGAYAGAAWDIFVLGNWQDIPEPKDHALVAYWKWLWEWQDEQVAKASREIYDAQMDRMSQDFREQVFYEA